MEMEREDIMCKKQCKLKSTQKQTTQEKESKAAVDIRTGENITHKHILKKLYHEKVSTNYQETGYTLLLLGHSDTYHIGKFTPAEHKDFSVIRTLGH